MKKIFAILLAIVMTLSMGVVAFAADTDTFVEGTPDYTVVVNAASRSVLPEKTELGEVYYKGYSFLVTVKNHTDSAIDAREFKLNVIAYNSETKTTYPVIIEEIIAPADGKFTAHSGGQVGGYIANIKVNVSKEINLHFDVTINDEKAQTITTLTETKEFVLIKAVEKVETTATPTEPSVETTTEAPTTVTTTLPNESETGGVDDELYPDVGDGNGYFDNTTTTKKPSNVESDIPNTGSGTAGMIAFGVLGVAALAALKMKKKKTDD